MAPKEIFWCGEGDLNPHEIAPASTSNLFISLPLMPLEAPWCPFSMLCREGDDPECRLIPLILVVN
jgi:hypothetical protein